MRLASPGVNVNSDNANFAPGNVNNGNATAGGNNLFNSNGNRNANSLAVRPVASINCGYIIKNYIRDNIETNHSPILMHMIISINKNR